MNGRRAVAPLALGALILGCSPQAPGGGRPDGRSESTAPLSASAPPRSRREPPPMDPKAQALVEAVKRKEYTAIALAKQIGAPAIAALTPIAGDADPEVRELAIACVAAIGGSDAEPFVIHGLLDPVQQVRIGAYQALYRMGASRTSAPALIAAFGQSPDALVRSTVALVFGRIEGASAAELLRVCAPEVDPKVKEDCIAALAKLGDPDARAELLRRLAATRPGPAGGMASPERKAYLERVEYIQAPWLLRALLPLLDDRSIALRIGADGIAMMPDHLRVCDVAVNLAASISKQPFSFPVDKKTNYTDAAIEEVRRALRLRALPP